MSDHLAVMRSGRVEQIGPPAEVYERPASVYVADFLGVSNLMEVVVEGREAGQAQIRLGDRMLTAADGHTIELGRAAVAIRPERIRLCTVDDAATNVVVGRVERLVYAGPQVQVLVDLGGEVIQAVIPNHGGALGFEVGDQVGAHMPPEALRLLSPDPAAEVPA